MDKLVKLTVENRTIYNLFLNKLNFVKEFRDKPDAYAYGKNLAFLYNKFM